jgi:hypothetical protein
MIIISQRKRTLPNTGKKVCYKLQLFVGGVTLEQKELIIALEMDEQFQKCHKNLFLVVENTN